MISNPLVVSSPDLTNPHGLTFLDLETLVVADRGGGVPVFEIPPRGTSARNISVAPQIFVRGTASFEVDTPGSVAAIPLDPRR